MVLLVVVAAGVAIALFLFFQHSRESSDRSDAIQGSVEEAQAALAAGDASTALRVLAGALREHPEAAALHLISARAYCARGRFKDALEACAKTDELDLDRDQADERRFIAGRAIAGRYLETGATDDRKRSEAELRPMFSDPRFGDAARIMIGRVLTRNPTTADATQRREAIELLEAGLANSSAREWLNDFESAQQHLATLKAAESKSGG